VISATYDVRGLPACLAAAALAGCASVVPPPQSESLPEGAWELVTSNFVESGRLPGLPRPTLEIGAGRIAAYSGCNRGSGTVRSAAGRLAVDRLEIARRDCPEPVGRFDTRYFALLRGSPVYHLNGKMLHLIAGDYNAQFRRR
jgi:heat shock protein HslJ